MDGEKSGGAGSPVESNAVQAEKAGTYSAHMPASIVTRQPGAHARLPDWLAHLLKDLAVRIALPVAPQWWNRWKRDAHGQVFKQVGQPAVEAVEALRARLRRQKGAGKACPQTTCV